MLILETDAEIVAIIAEIDIAIAEARRMSEYTLETGQSTQRVRRQKLSELRKERREWVAKLQYLRGGGNTQFVNTKF